MISLVFFIRSLLMSAPKLLLSIVLVSAPALAHDLWIEKEGSGYVLFQGHRHSAHSGAEIVPYEPAAVRAATCVDPSGKTRTVAFSRTYPAKLTAECETLLANFSTGYWTKTAWETKNAPKTGISGVIKSWYSEESLKYVERWGAASATPVGAGLEITPAANPLGLKTGDKLQVLVTDGGKPVSGVPVAYAGDTRGASGPDGKVAVRLRQGGVQLIEASLETPLADGKADSAVRTASLQFEIAK
jgi:nickel transport protein